MGTVDEHATAHIQPDPDTLEEPTAGIPRMDTGERRIDVPMPPEGTANYGYEMKVAIWRERATDLIYELRNQIREYRDEEKHRHHETLAAIEGRGKAWVAFWEWLRDASTGCIKGVTAVVTEALRNENGQLKWVALILIGLAGIVNGVAVTGLGFTIGDVVEKAAGGEIEETPAGKPDRPVPAP